MYASEGIVVSLFRVFITFANNQYTEHVLIQIKWL